LELPNIILAFAGRVLLRRADIRFERGKRYGLIGQNGVGKTTLLNRLAAKDINGFPQDLRVWYIRHEVQCEDGIDVRSYMRAMAPAGMGTDETVVSILEDVGFPEMLQTSGVSQLSGGWKMKLSIALSMLNRPELLLLDEPTNHLDRSAITWLTKHLLSLEGVTIALVSHDYEFVEEVATDIVHYDNLGQAGKPCLFTYNPMKFKQFQKLKPEIAAGLPTADKAMQTMGKLADGNVDGLADEVDNLSVDGSQSSSSAPSDTLGKVEKMMESGQILPIRFPDPGKPEGIRTFRKPIMTISGIHFKYPETERWVLTNASATVTLGSRAVLLGANGVGKSTFLKLLIGDLEPTEGKGEMWRHHNLRLSYIAQHSLHHLEDYLQSTPINYIQERFRQGLDSELAKLKTVALTEEEVEQRKDLGNVAEVVGRAKRGKDMWYELEISGRKKMDTKWFPEEEIKTKYKPYVIKLMKNYDMKQQALDSGLAIRPITSTEILTHLDEFGITSELAHGKIRQMSGGQRQRLVLAAAFWSMPHLIALDEPTNYLDNDTLAALTLALKNFKGAVVTVSHNEAFVAEISNEKWIVQDGEITVVQLRDARAR